MANDPSSLPTQSSTADDSVCGHCGYQVNGLPTNICPECGSDLAVVGVCGPHLWPRLLPSTRRNLLLALWTAGCAGAAAYLWFLMWALWDPVTPCTVMESDSYFLASTEGNVAIEYATGYRGHFWPWEVEGTSSQEVQFDRFDDAITGWLLRISLKPITSPTPADQVLNLDGGQAGSDTEKRFCVDLDAHAYAYDDPGGPTRVRKSGSWENDFTAWMDQMAERYKCKGLAVDMRLGRRWACMGDMPYRSGELPGQGAFFEKPQPGQFINITGEAGSNRCQHNNWWWFGGALTASILTWAAGVMHIFRRSRRGRRPASC